MPETTEMTENSTTEEDNQHPTDQPVPARGNQISGTVTVVIAVIVVVIHHVTFC